MKCVLAVRGRSLKSVVGNNMKVIFKNQAKKCNNSEHCLAIEYPINDKDISGTIIELKGRFPNKGMIVNLKCKELIYIENFQI